MDRKINLSGLPVLLAIRVKLILVPIFGNFVSTTLYLFLVGTEMKSPVCTLLRLTVWLRYSMVVKFGICHVQSIDI